MTGENTHLGLSGRLTRTTLNSPLTPLFLLVAILLGLLAVMSIPREEEPQISVPMIDISISDPGVKAADGVELIAKPLEAIVKSVSGVDHVYSFVDDDRVLVTARFKVGTDPDNAAIRIHEKISANMARLPAGVAAPLIQERGINDVPALVLTLSPHISRSGPGAGDRMTDQGLYELAVKLRSELAKVDNVGLTFIVGGRPEELRVQLDAGLMRAHGVSLEALTGAIKAADTVAPLGTVRDDNRALSVSAGKTLQNAQDIGRITVPSITGQAVLVRDVATVVEAPREDQSHVFRYSEAEAGNWVQTPAVSLAIAKRQGANAVTVAQAILNRVAALKGPLIPATVNVAVTRDYGESANEKANELLFHLGLATVSIVALIGFAIGWREAGVTAVVIPTTILLTLFASNLMGYTINRVSLFALIFSIGILVDDAIVMIENISRHWAMSDGRTRAQATIDAVAEVGNPTVIATLTVVAALLPMLFVSGLMGPYMAPIPVNASAAMIFSFFVAVILAPWLMIRFARKALPAGHRGDEGFISKVYRRVAGAVIKDKRTAWRFLLFVGAATLAACALFATRTVTVKLLPFDNKSELQVIADLPEGTSLETTQRVLNQAAHVAAGLKEVEAIDSYAGTAAPFNFNGLVRHYYFRQFPEQGDLNVQLSPRDKRSRASHAIALDLRERLKAVPLPAGGVLKIVEAPPGPPVMATLLAEVYGPDDATRRAVAERVKSIFKSVPYIVDVDDSWGVAQPRVNITTDRPRLEGLNVSDSQVYAAAATLMNGEVLGYSQRGQGRDPVEIAVRLPQSQRTLSPALVSMPVATSQTNQGIRLVSLDEVAAIETTTASTHIYRRDGHDVDMIMAELAGKYEAPVYGIFDVNDRIKAAEWGATGTPAIRLNGQPNDETHPTVLWDGEWEITWVTFRDMGGAFGVALLGIYALVVAQFKSFKLPLVILTPVPLTLIGIVLGHILFHAPFTATSMIGFIALAGIIVRNSILLVDFIRHARGDGRDRPLKEVLLDAGATRFKPILLTALAAMIGAAVILTDPIFQGLAISLLFGLLSSTLLTVLVIPAIYVALSKEDIT